MSEWRETTLGDFVSLQRGHDLPHHSRRPGRFPVIGSGGITGSHDTAMARGPGVTIGRAANLGLPTLVQDDFWPLNTTLYVTDFHGNDVQFAYYLLRTLDLTGFNSGSVQPMLNRNYIRSFPIKIPSPEGQQAISAVLGSLDDKVAVNEKISRTCNELMTASYAQAIAQGVMTTILGNIADLFDGPHATPRKTHAGPWFLSISSLNGGRLVLSESARLSDADFQRWTRRVEPLPGDVLFSYETRLGEAALMPVGIRACLGRRMALLRPRDNAVGSRTLLQAFLSGSFQDTIRQRSIHGATVDRIPLTSLSSWPIELPTHRTQQLEEALGQLDELAASKERESEKLQALRDTLLPKLMSGEIRIRDAERIVEDAT